MADGKEMEEGGRWKMEGKAMMTQLPKGDCWMELEETKDRKLDVGEEKGTGNGGNRCT